MPITKTDYIWMDGELVNWDDANVHVLTHSLHYGCGVFEGVRAYKTAEGAGVFRLTDHINRLFASARMLMMEIPYSPAQLVEAVKQTVVANKIEECYIRPIVYLGYGEMGLNTLNCQVNTSIAVWPWGAYLGDEGIEKGVRVKVSSWRRHDPNAMPSAAKSTGMYINSSLAKAEALKSGYDEAVLLSQQGYVSECTGENIFVVRNDRIVTPPLASGPSGRHNPGLRAHHCQGPRHRRGVRQPLAQRPLCRRGGVHERDGGRGRAHFVGRRPGRGGRHAGPGDQEIQDIYKAAVRGQVDRYRSWVEHAS